MVGRVSSLPGGLVRSCHDSEIVRSRPIIHSIPDKTFRVIVVVSCRKVAPRVQSSRGGVNGKHPAKKQDQRQYARKRPRESTYTVVLALRLQNHVCSRSVVFLAKYQ